LLCAVAGCVSAAAGQTGSLNIVASQTVIDTTVSSVLTLSVFASADFGTHIAGGGFALAAVGGGGIVQDMDGEAVLWAQPGDNDRGHLGDGNYRGFVFGQFTILPNFPPAPESELGAGAVHVVTFTVELAAFQYGVIEWTVTTDPFSPPEFLGIFDSNTNSTTLISDVAFGSVQISVVPAPSALALVGLGGLVVGRRRR